MARHVFEYMKHLRFVHNAQTILSLAVIYLVLSSWTSGTEVLSDLDKFLETMEVARSVVERPTNLVLLVPSVRDARARRNRELFQKIRHRVTIAAPSRIEQMTPLPRDSAPIGMQWRKLQEQVWTVSEVNISQHDFIDVRDWYARWYARWRHCLPHFERDLREEREEFSSRPLSQAEIRRFTTPALSLVAADWEGHSSFVSATVEMKVYLPETPGSWSCRPHSLETPTPRDLRRGGGWVPAIERKEFGPYRFAVQKQPFRLPPSTFERYPYLQRVLTSTSDLTPNEVREWAAENKVSEIRGREPRLLGTSIRGEDLGVVAPLTISAVHLYLLITLLTVFGNERRQTQLEGSLPWLATMESTLPTLFTAVTLALCPAVAAGLALWRLTTIGLFGAGVWSVVLLALGTCVVVLARKLGNYSVG